MFFGGPKKRPKMTKEEANAIIQRAQTEEPLDLEKGDFAAMIIAALMVFLPFLLALSGSLLLLWWLLFHVLGS